MSQYGMLMTTLPSKNAAAKMARLLIEGKLAACVQLCGIESFYRWKGETVNASETLLLIKTRTALFEAAIAHIQQKHPYSVPEIVGTEFTTGFKGYFDWIDEVTAPQAKAAAQKPPTRKAKPHPAGDGKVSAKKSRGLRTGISRPMRVK